MTVSQHALQMKECIRPRFVPSPAPRLRKAGETKEQM